MQSHPAPRLIHPETDCDILAGLHAQCYRRVWTADTFRDLLKTGAGFILTQETTPLGFIIFSLAADQSDLLSIGVVPECQNKGYGGVLLGNAVNYLKNKGIQEFFLEVDTDNIAALTLYRRYGFEKIGVRKNYYPASAAESRDAMTMRRIIQI